VYILFYNYAYSTGMLMYSATILYNLAVYKSHKTMECLDAARKSSSKAFAHYTLFN